MLRHSLVRLENLQKLTELQRDLVGVESLIAPGRVSGSMCMCLSWRPHCLHRDVSHTAQVPLLKPSSGFQCV